MPTFTVEVYSNGVWVVTRRKHGEGSIYQRKDGSWVAQFKGKYRYAKDEESAKRKLYAMLSGAEETKPANITVAAALDEYLERIP